MRACDVCPGVGRTVTALADTTRLLCHNLAKVRRITHEYSPVRELSLASLW